VRNPRFQPLPRPREPVEQDRNFVRGQSTLDVYQEAVEVHVAAQGYKVVAQCFGL
jgi:hypothetical protein